MAKFYGTVGYRGEPTEIKPGIWSGGITEKKAYFELIRNTKLAENPGQFNNNINISNQVSFIADPYARKNFHQICYVEFMGTKWKVNSVDVQFPRLVLMLGGVYIGEEQN